MPRQGQLSYILRVLIITIAVVIVLFVANPFQEATETGLERQYAQLDMQRMLNPFITLQGQGMGQVQVDLRNSFEEIDLRVSPSTPSATGLYVEAEFLDSQKKIDLPPMFDYVENDVSGSTLCVRKRGQNFSISSSCSVMAPCDVRGPVCSYNAGSVGSTADRAGYICRNGTYVNQNFYEELYTTNDSSCTYASYQSLMVMERFSTPDDIIRHQTQPGSPLGAVTWSALQPMFAFTYRCYEKDSTLSPDPYQVEVGIHENNASADYPLIERETYECDTEIQHKRFVTQDRVDPAILDDWYKATKGSGDPYIDLVVNLTKPNETSYHIIDKQISIREESSGTPEQVPRG